MGRGDASNIREALAPLMPKPGEDRSSVSDVFANVYGQCIELMAGRAAERMLLSDGDPEPPVGDLRQARELALLICGARQQLRRSSRTAMRQRVICCSLTAML
jgi:hypothetical protein